MLWVPIIEKVSVTANAIIPVGNNKVLVRTVAGDGDALVAVVFRWHEVPSSTRMLIPGKCSTLVNADDVNRYSIAGWIQGDFNART